MGAVGNGPFTYDLMEGPMTKKERDLCAERIRSPFSRLLDLLKQPEPRRPPRDTWSDFDRIADNPDGDMSATLDARKWLR